MDSALCRQLLGADLQHIFEQGNADDLSLVVASLTGLPSSAAQAPEQQGQELLEPAQQRLRGLLSQPSAQCQVRSCYAAVQGVGRCSAAAAGLPQQHCQVQLTAAWGFLTTRQLIGRQPAATPAAQPLGRAHACVLPRQYRHYVSASTLRCSNRPLASWQAAAAVMPALMYACCGSCVCSLQAASRQAPGS